MCQRVAASLLPAALSKNSVSAAKLCGQHQIKWTASCIAQRRPGALPASACASACCNAVTPPRSHKCWLLEPTAVVTQSGKWRRECNSTWSLAMMLTCGPKLPFLMLRWCPVQDPSVKSSRGVLDGDPIGALVRRFVCLQFVLLYHGEWRCQY
jgi:hypothetical protein